MTKHFKIKDISLDDIVIRKEQLHDRNFDKDIDKLASSISKTGLLQPIYVCPADEHGKYMLLTGERYLLAHKKLHKKTIKAVVVRKLNQKEIRQVHLAESRQRRVYVVLHNHQDE